MTSTTRIFQEPEFSGASVHFADEVANQLIEAADLARPAWHELIALHSDSVSRLQEETLSNPHLFRTPLVWGFAKAWGNAMRWPKQAVYRDGISIGIPSPLVRDLQRFGNIQSLEFFLAAIGADCSAQLGSNEHNLEYGLYVNVPAWIRLGAEPQFRDSFARQIRMVIFHETAHFRYIHADLRQEHIAHARGVASLRTSWPESRDEIAALLDAEHPEAWSNAEIRDLVLNTVGGYRLIRSWSYKIRRVVDLRSGLARRTPL